MQSIRTVYLFNDVRLLCLAMKTGNFLIIFRLVLCSLYSNVTLNSITIFDDVVYYVLE